MCFCYRPWEIFAKDRRAGEHSEVAKKAIFRERVHGCLFLDGEIRGVSLPGRFMCGSRERGKESGGDLG